MPLKQILPGVVRQDGDPGAGENNAFYTKINIAERICRKRPLRKISARVDFDFTFRTQRGQAVDFWFVIGSRAKLKQILALQGYLYHE